MPRLLAIDPGTAFVGLVVLTPGGEVAAKGTIKLSAIADPEARIRTLTYDLHSFCLQHCKMEPATHGSTPPNVAVLEQYKTYGLKGSIVNAFMMGRVVQAIYDTLIATGRFKDIHTVSARDARRYITDNPNAKDAQIKEGLRALGYDMKSNAHERDALALGLYWLNQRRGAA